MVTQAGLKTLSRRECYLPILNRNEGITRIAEVCWDAGSNNYHRQSAFTMFRLITKGCLYVLNRRNVVETLHGGDLLVHPAGDGYHLQVPQGQQCTLWLLAVHGDRFHQRWQERFPGRYWTRPSTNSAECHHLLNMLFARATEQNKAAARACLQYLDLVLDHCARSNASTRPTKRNERFLEACDLLQHDLHLPMDCDTVTAALSINRSTLHRWFTDQLGISPMAYRQRQRLHKAAQLLNETSETLDTIATQVGYRCPFALSKAFKREFGLSPQDFRN